MRTWVKVLIGLVVFLMIAAVGVAWYFSSLILDGATIKGETQEYANEVTQISADGNTGTITYTVNDTVEDPATDYNSTGISGLAFEDGAYLQLAADVTVDGRSVTRPYELLAGEAPEVGELGRFDFYAYPNADTLGGATREVEYESPLGPMPAIIVEPVGTPNGIWVIGVHGRNASIREPMRAVPLYAERGMTTMLINYRDDKKEEGIPYEDGLGNFGLTEWEDLQAAVQYATDNGAEKIILAGWSMGGAIVASYLENGSGTDAVIGTHLVSPAMSFNQIVEFGANRLGIPVDQIAPIVTLALEITELRANNVDFDATEYEDNAADWPVPAVVTAATEDDLVPPESIEEFANNLPDGEFKLFTDAVHTGEWNYDPEAFDQLVGQWLDQFAPAQQP